MAAQQTGIRLLSALRRAGSTLLLAEIPEELFTEDEELAAFRWLREYVRQHRSFPTPETFRRHTSIQTLVTQEQTNYYIEEAQKRAIYRSALPMFNQLKEGFTNRNIQEIITSATNIAGLEKRYQRGPAAQTFAETLNRVVTDMQEARWAQIAGRLRGVETGYRFMNRITAGGWQGSDNIALAGRIGMGKTYLLLKHALSAWMAGYNVLFQSNEMGDLQLARRMVAMQSGYDSREILRGRLGSWAERKIGAAIETMKDGVPFKCVAGNFATSTAVLRALCDEYEPDLICVDASYLLKPEKRMLSRRENLVDVADDLKRISIERERPLIHTVQFNRTAVKPPKKERETGDTAERDNDPVAYLGLHMIAETDAVAANASIVVGLAPVLGRKDRRYYAILKGREGERGLATINYDFERMNFDEVTPEQIEAETSELINHME